MRRPSLLHSLPPPLLCRVGLGGPSALGDHASLSRDASAATVEPAARRDTRAKRYGRITAYDMDYYPYYRPGGITVPLLAVLLPPALFHSRRTELGGNRPRRHCGRVRA